MMEPDEDGPEAAPQLERIAGRPRQYRRDEEPFVLPRTEHNARDLKFTREHEYLSPACHHRQHADCEAGCPYCERACLCVCHRWAIPVDDDPHVASG